MFAPPADGFLQQQFDSFRVHFVDLIEQGANSAVVVNPLL
jgi:hypothetical protein